MPVVPGPAEETAYLPRQDGTHGGHGGRGSLGAHGAAHGTPGAQGSQAGQGSYGGQSAQAGQGSYGGQGSQAGQGSYGGQGSQAGQGSYGGQGSFGSSGARHGSSGPQSTGSPRTPHSMPPEQPYARRTPGSGGPSVPAPAPAPDLAGLAPNQRARAEGRSPVIPPGLKPAALTAALALLLAVTAPLPRPVLCVPVVLLQAVTAAGWFRLNGMWPARQGIALAFLAGLATDAGLLAADRDQAPVVALGTLGVWCLFVLVLQLRNRSSADERMYALTAGLTSTALVVLASGQLSATSDAVVVGAAAVAVTTLARALPLPSVVSVLVALLGGAGAGIAAGQMTGMGASGALLGLAAGGCALIGLRVASYDYPSRFVHMTAGVALPLTLAAPAVYVLGRALA
nr:hypothetical protein [Streptomyces sp. MST-110588]